MTTHAQKRDAVSVGTHEEICNGSSKHPKTSCHEGRAIGANHQRRKVEMKGFPGNERCLESKPGSRSIFPGWLSCFIIYFIPSYSGYGIISFRTAHLVAFYPSICTYPRLHPKPLSPPSHLTRHFNSSDFTSSYFEPNLLSCVVHGWYFSFPPLPTTTTLCF